MISYWADCCTFRIKTLISTTVLKIMRMEGSVVKTSRETTPKTRNKLQQKIFYFRFLFST